MKRRTVLVIGAVACALVLCLALVLTLELAAPDKGGLIEPTAGDRMELDHSERPALAPPEATPTEFAGIWQITHGDTVTLYSNSCAALERLGLINNPDPNYLEPGYACGGAP